LSSVAGFSTVIFSSPRAPARRCSIHIPASVLTSVMVPTSLSMSLEAPSRSAPARRRRRELRFPGCREVHLDVDEADAAAQVVVECLEDPGLSEPGRPGLVDAFLDERREE